MPEKKARIFLIDNDQRALNKLSDLLSMRNYEVKIVDLSSKDIVATAAILAKDFRPHVAVIDLRLYSEFMDDKVGLDVYKSMTSSWCILYSAHLTVEVTQDAKEKGFYKCIRKGGGSTKLLLKHIEEAVALHSSSYHNWKVPWPSAWTSSQILKAVMGEKHNLPTDIPDDILLQLLGRVPSSINLDTVDGSIKSRPPSSHLRSFVVKVKPEDKQPHILKLTDSTRADKEYKNYEEFINQKIPGGFYTRLEKNKQFWDMSGTVYSFIGSEQEDILSFDLYYQQNQEPESILIPLNFLFHTLWSEYYRTPRKCKVESLFELYNSRFHLTDLLLEISEYFKQICSNSTASNLLNPGEWIAQFKEASRLPNIYEAITHGDLHGDNLFVDGNYAWLIDFERTGYNHILCDFVELENSIVTRLIPENVEIAEIQKLMFMLAEFKSSENHLNLINQPELDKAYKVIMGLRNIAHEVASIHDRREYVWSLIFGTAKAASIEGITGSQKERAILYTSILCERLKRWNAPWVYTNLFFDITPNSTVSISENLILTGPQLGQLNDALDNAFTPDTLEHLLLYYLNRRLDSLTGNVAMRNMIHNILMAANREGWIGSLINAAYQDQPENLKLREFVYHLSSLQSQKY